MGIQIGKKSFNNHSFQKDLTNQLNYFFHNKEEENLCKITAVTEEN